MAVPFIKELKKTGLLNIKKIFAADVVKISFLNAVAVLIKMITAFVSIKVVASLSMNSPGGGPAALVLLGQLNNFAYIAMSICNGGITTGMTRYIAEYSSSNKKSQLFLGTGFWITSILSVIVGLTMIVLAGFFSELILKDSAYKSIFYIFGSTIIMYALNAWLISVINGFKEYKKYVLVNILGSLIGLIFTVILAYKFGIYGALVAIVTYQSVVFIVTLTLISKTNWFQWKKFISKFSKLAAFRLSHYSLMAVVTTVVMPASQLIIRNYVAQHESIQEAGLWEGINRISYMYLLVFASSLAVYYVPKLTELKTPAELHRESFSVLKLITPFLLVFTVILYLSRYLVINILYTKEFLGMQGLFAFQLLGDFIKISSWVFANIMVAKSMTRTFIIMELVSYMLQVLLSILFVNIYGIQGAPIGYAISHFIYMVCMVFIFRKIIFLKKNDQKIPTNL